MAKDKLIMDLQALWYLTNLLPVPSPHTHIQNAIKFSSLFCFVFIPIEWLHFLLVCEVCGYQRDNGKHSGVIKPRLRLQVRAPGELDFVLAAQQDTISDHISKAAPSTQHKGASRGPQEGLRGIFPKEMLCLHLMIPIVICRWAPHVP